FNLGLLFLLLEVGFRGWIHFSQENGAVFESQIDRVSSAQGEKRKISGEISLGKLISKSSHPGRVYQFQPDIEAVYLGQPFSTNSFGIRDKEYPIAKEEGLFRIVGLGDSIMFGWGVKAEESYLSLVETRLNSERGDGRRYEV